MEQQSKSDNVFDFTKNPKQVEFFHQVMLAISGKSDLRYFFYGGAIRGGKTAVCLTILIILARMFPNSRWHIIRESTTVLEATTIPSFEKFCPEGSASVKRYSRKSSNYFCEFMNGSKIFFVSESYYSDPELNWMLGLETNGIMLEQIEGLSEKCWSRALERTGSWYIDPMPPGIILSTFNPTQTWIKQKIHKPFIEGKLKAPYYYLVAKPSDNPYVTKDQWTGWGQLDPISYKQFIDGDWESIAVNKPFAYSFRKEKHIRETYYNPDKEIMLSFDFNIDPITAIAAQEGDNGEIYFIKEFRIPESDIYALCEMIKTEYAQDDPLFMITGDATGRNRTAMTRGNLSYYRIIQDELELGDFQMNKVPRTNPAEKDRRVLLNSLLSRGEVHIDPAMEWFQADLQFVEVDDEGEIKKDRSKETRKADLLDAGCYLLWAFFRHRLKTAFVEVDSVEEKFD